MNIKKFSVLAVFSAFACVAGFGSTSEEGSEAARKISDRTDAYVLETVTPKYPQEMLQRGIQGRTLLALRVNERGEVDKVRVVASTNDSFSEAAVKSVRNWYFAPGTKDGVDVPQTVMVPVNFIIEDLPTATVASL